MSQASKPRRARQPWTPAQVTVLRAYYPHLRAADVALIIGRTVSSVHQKALQLRLGKSDAFKASAQSGRAQRGLHSERIKATQFKPGHTTWNKGIKGSVGHHPNSRATQFKPGRPAHEARNYQPIGSLRVTKDGVLERKMTDDPAILPPRRWTPVARLVWEAAHGPIPPHHMVIFKPGMKTTELALITEDRLECISRAENARRNHPNQRHPELAKLYQLKGAITRQVNRINRETQEAHA